MNATPIQALRAMGIAISLAALTACASGTTTVTMPVQNAAKVKTVNVAAGQHTVEVDPSQVAAFDAQLREKLYHSNVFSEGNELTLRYRYIQFNPGSQAMRYFVGMGVGKGSQTIEVSFVAPDGRELGKINVGGEISGGMFGGALKEATEKAADEAAKYAVSQFW